MTPSLVRNDHRAHPVDVTVFRAAASGAAEAGCGAHRKIAMVRLWLLWLGATVLFCGGQTVVGRDGWVADVMTLAMPLLFTVGILAGVVLNRPRPRWPWLLLASAGAITAAGIAISWSGADTLAFAALMSVYPIEAAALLLVTRGASWRRDRAGLLDTAMISVGLALACWLLVITPIMRLNAVLPGSPRTVLLPFGDLLLLSVLIRFFISQGVHNAAFWQISVSLLLQTTAHLTTLLYPLWGFNASDLQPVISLAALLMVGAAIHPSMCALARQPLRPVADMTPRRVLLVNLACMGAPILLIAQGVLQHGRVDWLAAGVGCVTLFALLALRMVDLISQLHDKARQLEAVAHIDALTALPNRRAWNLELHRRVAAARRHDAPVVVAIIDLDHFKRYNDEHGHQGGDELLTIAAVAWKAHIRPEDLLARYGGEEFGVILDQARLADADRIIERLQSATPLGQTFSAGAAQWNGSETAEELLARADAALYAAKRAGRDRLYVSSTR
ncbi:GGDEF domain-containing protein [Actinoplanes sp. Pm04-4]|uniref:GGDEF domain-containing protein n=1 Tax=Paractinoplanes pyxinae TaxID=2997416 RepID=A0ABT4BGU7_9ACTN|nr:GGDEF domain-containing protein [Actinoplanes pyxinae]MCY1145760.1 GGDEF domain-containing protein [Actinoplanes pyxinae]